MGGIIKPNNKMEKPNPKNYSPADLTSGKYQSDLEKYIYTIEQNQLKKQFLFKLIADKDVIVKDIEINNQIIIDNEACNDLMLHHKPSGHSTMIVEFFRPEPINDKNNSRLTVEEMNERNRLLELQSDHNRWFAKDEFDRLKELSERMASAAGFPHE